MEEDEKEHVLGVVFQSFSLIIYTGEAKNILLDWKTISNKADFILLKVIIQSCKIFLNEANHIQVLKYWDIFNVSSEIYQMAYGNSQQTVTLTFILHRETKVVTELVTVTLPWLCDARVSAKPEGIKGAAG